jgi:hypothetical protein
MIRVGSTWKDGRRVQWFFKHLQPSSVPLCYAYALDGHAIMSAVGASVVSAPRIFLEAL